MLDKQWFLKYQKILLFLANTKVGRHLLGLKNSSVGKNKIIKILPNAIFWQEGKKYKAEFRTHNKFSKRLFYAFKPVWGIFHAWDVAVANKLNSEWNLGFDTFGPVYPDANPETTTVDGSVRRAGVNEVFSTIRGGAGTLAGDTDAAIGPIVESSTTTNQFTRIQRSIYLFDTSAMNDAATITAAVLSLFGTAKANGLGGSPEHDITSSNPASNTSLASSDYGNLGSTSFGSVTYANWSTSAYNDHSLNASGLAAISKTGISKFGGRVNWDTNGTFGGSWASAQEMSFSHYASDQAGTTNDPKLVVTFTLGGDTGYAFFI